MNYYIYILALAGGGLFETVYLIWSRYKKNQPYCVLGGDACREVLESKYNRIFGVHNDLIGLAFYISVICAALIILFGLGPIEVIELLTQIAMFFAAGFSVFLIGLQKFVIKSWCFWCIVSAVINMTMAYLMFWKI